MVVSIGKEQRQRSQVSEVVPVSALVQALEMPLMLSQGGLRKEPVDVHSHPEELQILRRTGLEVTKGQAKGLCE